MHLRGVVSAEQRWVVHVPEVYCLLLASLCQYQLPTAVIVTLQCRFVQGVASAVGGISAKDKRAQELAEKAKKVIQQGNFSTQQLQPG